ncbi:COP23 domain-containing protein [Crocosphaera sp. Alani8]|uniref:COP23 domain-containing protein n=1 Tax=Crocosphaera sp. Alani8 TaxID=3038952 RepID=UPI00313D21E9
MVNNSAKFIALGTLATVGVLGLVSEAQAQHFVYPLEIEQEEEIAYVDWDSNPGPRAFERRIQKVVFECVPQADGTYATEEKVVEITFNPAKAAPVGSTFDPHNPYSGGVYSSEDVSSQYIALGELTGQPMILWTEDRPSSNPEGLYTPQSRCETVSARLTNLAYAFGETTPIGVAQAFTERMGTGVVNGETVIFISYDPENPSTENVVFTLKPENGATFAEAQRTLAQFNNSISGSIGGEDPEITKLGPIVE